MDLGRKAAARAAESLAVLPPFEPAADTCARAVVESSICTRWAVELVAASASNMASNTPDRPHSSPHFLHDGEDVLVCERGGCDRRRSFISAGLARGAPPRTTPR